LGAASKQCEFRTTDKFAPRLLQKFGRRQNVRPMSHSEEDQINANVTGHLLKKIVDFKIT
jgi:hypothetical protein